MATKTERVEIRVTKELLDLIDVAREDVTRTRWIERALESALDAEGMPVEAIRKVRARPNPMPAEPPAEFAVSEKKPKQKPSLRDTWAR